MRILPGAAAVVAVRRGRIAGGLAAGAIAAGRPGATRGATPYSPAKPQPGRGDYRDNNQLFQHLRDISQKRVQTGSWHAPKSAKSQITNKDQVPNNKFQTRCIRSLASHRRIRRPSTVGQAEPNTPDKDLVWCLGFLFWVLVCLLVLFTCLPAGRFGISTWRAYPSNRPAW